MDIDHHQRDEDERSLPFVVWRLPPAHVAISSAAVGGGFGQRAWAINAQVPIGYDRTDLVKHIDELRLQAGLPSAAGVGMLTGANLDGAKRANEEGVEVFSSVGVSEPEWAAGPARVQARSRPGTINVMAWIPVALSPAALVNAVITTTEAKSQAMIDGGLEGTGTATDAVCLACPATGLTEPFAGPRSQWGHRLAVAVHATILEGITNAKQHRAL